MSSLLSTLAEFVSAGLRPRTPLAKALVLTSLVKLCAVVLLRLFPFNSASLPPVDHEATQLRLFGPVSTASERHNTDD
jgi:hypothetical protein